MFFVSSRLERYYTRRHDRRREPVSRHLHGDMIMRVVRSLGALCLVGCAAVTVVGQSGAANGEWRSYGGDLGHTRYAPLDQINAANFNKLEVAWRFKTDNLGPRPEFQFEVDAADGQRRRLHDRRLAARRRRARRRHRRAAVDAQRERRRTRRDRAAAALGPRPGVLDRRHATSGSCTSRRATG